MQDVRELIERWDHDCLKTLREEPDLNEAGYFCAWIDAAVVASGGLVNAANWSL